MYEYAYVQIMPRSHAPYYAAKRSGTVIACMHTWHIMPCAPQETQHVHVIIFCMHGAHLEMACQNSDVANSLPLKCAATVLQTVLGSKAVFPFPFSRFQQPCTYPIDHRFMVAEYRTLRANSLLYTTVYVAVL